MKLAAAIFLIAIRCSFATRDRDRDWRSGSGSDDLGVSGSRFGASRPCLIIRGYVRCGDETEKHDGKTAVLRFHDGIRGTLDEGYSSKRGYFELFGCTLTSGTFQPELHVLHTCKGNQPRKLKVAIPESARNEYNITDVIDLKAYAQHEEDYAQPINFPCDIA